MGASNQEPRWNQPPGQVPQDPPSSQSAGQQPSGADWPVLPSSASSASGPTAAYGGTGQPGPGPGGYGYDTGFGFLVDGEPGQAPSLDPLSRPLYGASFGQAVSRYFRKYAVFSGRASRSEYLWVALFQFCVFVLLGVLGGVTANAEGVQTVAGLLVVVWLLGSIVPSISLGVRRLHDAGQSGWLYLLCLIPYLGSLIVLILCCLPSSPAGARHDT